MDPRALANLIIDIASAHRAEITNLSLNKIAYFMHGLVLAKFGVELMNAKIEAWQYGPVIREIYSTFKKNGRAPITEKATRINFETDEIEFYRETIDPEILSFIKAEALTYLKMSPSKLVNLSHIEGGPWHNAWFHDQTINPGMEITNEAIRLFFTPDVRH